MTQKPDNPQAMTYEQLTKPDIDLPRYPAWKVTVNDLGCKRESIMTQAEFDKWRIEQWSIKS